MINPDLHQQAPVQMDYEDATEPYADDFPPLLAGKPGSSDDPQGFDIEDDGGRIYAEKLRDSGSGFISYLRHNYLKGDKPKVNFLARSLKYLLTSLDFSEKSLLVLIHKPEHPSIQQTVTKLAMDKDLSHLINSSFNIIGLLSTSPEIKIMLRFMQPSALPCLAIMRLTKTPQRQVSLDSLISLANDPSVEAIHGSLLGYVKQRNAQGSKLAVVERGALEAIGRQKMDKERE